MLDFGHIRFRIVFSLRKKYVVEEEEHCHACGAVEKKIHWNQKVITLQFNPEQDIISCALSIDPYCI